MIYICAITLKLNKMVDLEIYCTSDKRKKKISKRFWKKYSTLHKYFRDYVANDPSEMGMIRKLYIMAYNDAVEDCIEVLPIKGEERFVDEVVSEVLSLIKEI